jgi:adenylate cyclase
VLRKLFSDYRKNYRRVLLGLLVVGLFLWHDFSNPQIFPTNQGGFRIPLLTKLEALVYDTRLKYTMPNTVHPGVVILDIDEKSLQEREKGGEGHWPWPRDRIAALLDKLFDKYQIEVLGFDIVFAERDAASGSRVLERLAKKELSGVPQFQGLYEQIKGDFDNDDLFARKLRGRKVVMGLIFSNEVTPIIKGALPAPIRFGGAMGDRKLDVPVVNGYTANLPELQKNAASGGHFNPFGDADGVIRRVAMFQEYGGAYYEALSLAMLRLYLDSPPINFDIDASADYGAADNLVVAGLKIPVGHKTTTLIPYRGKQRSFNYISVVDVLNDRVDVADLKGKIVLVGTTAPGLQDLRVTPFDGVYPGVEVHANLIAGALDGTIKQMPVYALALQLMLILLVGIVLALALPQLSILGSTVLAIAMLAATVGANFALYQYGNFVLPLASSVMMILVLYASATIWGYFTESRGKKQIQGFFGQYVPPEIVDEMVKNPDTAEFEPHSRECTILFTDVRGFTTISEGLDPKELSELMNQFLTPLTRVIHAHKGTIDKYMGDCIMGFWGAPTDNPAHAHSGVIAALEMHKTLMELQPQFRAKNWPEIKIGIGLNTGRVSVGNMGSEWRLAYTVMGDAVNLASRLEGITKEYGADIIVGEDTMKAAPEIIFRELDRVRVKGKENAVTIYQPIGPRSVIAESTIERLNQFDEVLRTYRKQDWDAAEAQLRRLHETSPENKLYELFLDRIPVLREKNLDPDWDGAFTFETK